MVTPGVRREAVAQACATHGVSQRRACQALAVDRSSVRYLSIRPDRCRSTGRHESRGERTATVRLPTHPCDAGAAGDRDEPQEAAAALSKRTAAGAPSGRSQAGLGNAATDAGSRCPEHPVEPRLCQRRADGRAAQFRVLALVDDHTRECLALVADTSLSGQRVVRELDVVIAKRGRPAMIVSDNGTEFTSIYTTGRSCPGASAPG